MPQPGYVTLTDGTGALLATVPTSPTPPAATTVLNQASAAQTASGNAATVTSGVATLEIDINVTAITGGVSPTITFSYTQQGADGVAYTVWTGTAINAAGSQRVSIGPGLATTAVILSAGHLVWTFGGGTPPTSVTFSASIVGR